MLLCKGRKKLDEIAKKNKFNVIQNTIRENFEYTGKEETTVKR